MRSTTLALTLMTAVSLLVGSRAWAESPAPEKAKVAIAAFVNQAGSSLEPWWSTVGANETRNAAYVELSKSSKFVPFSAVDLDALCRSANVTLSDPLDPKVALALGKADHGLKYLVIGAMTKFTLAPSSSGVSGVAALNAKMINLANGDVVWTDEGRHSGASESTGPSSGASIDKMFDKLVKPVIAQLLAELEVNEL